MPSLILASASPRRKKLLAQLSIPFTVQPSSVGEHFDNSWTPDDIVQQLALRKARDVATSQPDAVIIGADTVVVHDGTILEKPESADEAEAMLHALSDSSHQVLTGVALIKTDSTSDIIDENALYESTHVTFGSPEPEEIRAYVATGSPMDKAGAYGIQDDWGAFFVKRIEGDYNNIVGLPLYALYQKLKSFAPQLLRNG